LLRAKLEIFISVIDKKILDEYNAADLMGGNSVRLTLGELRFISDVSL
jgi:hypothetical protein